MLEQDEAEVRDGDVVEQEPAPPGLGEGRMDQEDVGQEHRQGGHEHGIAEHHPAPAAEQDRAPLAALAGQGHEALAPHDQPLDQHQQDGDAQQRHGIGRRHLDPDRIAEELEKLGRDDVEACRDRDQGGRAEQRDRLQEADDHAAQDGRQRERQGHLAHRPPWSRTQDVGGILHLRRDELERRRREDEDVGERIERDDDGEAGEAVDVERSSLRPRRHHVETVEPACVRAGQQDPGDGAGVGRRDEGRQHEHAREAAARHVRARDRPGQRHGEDTGQQRGHGAELQRIDKGVDVTRPTVRRRVIGKGEFAGTLRLEAGDDQVNERAHHQEQKDRDDRDPEKPGRIEPAGAHGAHRHRVDRRSRYGHCRA